MISVDAKESNDMNSFEVGHWIAELPIWQRSNAKASNFKDKECVAANMHPEKDLWGEPLM